MVIERAGNIISVVFLFHRGYCCQWLNNNSQHMVHVLLNTWELVLLFMLGLQLSQKQVCAASVNFDILLHILSLFKVIEWQPFWQLIE